MLESHFPNYTNRNSILELNASPHFIHTHTHTHTYIHVSYFISCIYLLYIKISAFDILLKQFS